MKIWKNSLISIIVSKLRDRSMLDMTRRQILASTAVIATGGAGLTAAQGLDAASVSGDVDVQSEQALTVTDVSVEGGDASFSRVGDDNTTIQVAVEANNSDAFEIEPTIENSSADKLAIRIIVNTPDAISITNVDDSPDGNSDSVVQSDTDAYVTKIEPNKTTFELSFEISDVAQPGARDISIDFEPMSTDN
uniref:Uncharacterized protein n=1 Tax=uncultured haloarchaeon TaxID=160804 RepID=A5YT05_9EURY|nr:hypothetical protein [uncultured haloarchaeon]